MKSVVVVDQGEKINEEKYLKQIENLRQEVAYS